MSSNTLKTILGAALIGASFLIPGLGQLLSTALLFAGSTLVASGLRPNLAGKQEGILRNDASTQASIPVIYGTTLVGIRPADYIIIRNNNNFLFIVGALCHGSEDGGGIQAIDEVYADDRLLCNADGSVTAPFKTFFGTLPAATLTKFLGTDTQTVYSGLNGNFPNAWPTTSRGKGIAYIVLELRFDEKVWINGIPNITVRVRGRRVYDTRSATWVYSTNPAMCIRDYVLSTICGVGADAGEIDEQSFIDGANYCDELITTFGSATQKRFECNGWLDTGNKVTENLQTLLSSCRGELAYIGGKFSLVIRKATTPTGFKLTRENTIGVLKATLPGTDSMPNVMEATFIDPTKRYQTNTVQWPDVADSNAFLAEDNGFKTVAQISLQMTNNPYTCRQILQVILRERRLGRLAMVGAKEAVLTQQIGDLIEVTNDTLGWTDQKCWIFSLGIAMDGTVAVGLMTYDAAMYSADGQTQSPGNPPTEPAPGTYDFRVPISPIHGCIAVTVANTHPGFVQLKNPAGSGVLMVLYEIRLAHNVSTTAPTYMHVASTPKTLVGSVTTGYLEHRDQRNTDAIKAVLQGCDGLDSTGKNTFDDSFWAASLFESLSTHAKMLSGWWLEPDSFPIIIRPGETLEMITDFVTGCTLQAAFCFDEVVATSWANGLQSLLPASDRQPFSAGDPRMQQCEVQGYIKTPGSLSSGPMVQLLNPPDSSRVLAVHELRVSSNGGAANKFYARRTSSTYFAASGVGYSGATILNGSSWRRDRRSALGAAGVLQGTNLHVQGFAEEASFWGDFLQGAGARQPGGEIILRPLTFPIIVMPGMAIQVRTGGNAGVDLDLYAAWDEWILGSDAPGGLLPAGGSRFF